MKKQKKNPEVPDQKNRRITSIFSGLPPFADGGAALCTFLQTLDSLDGHHVLGDDEDGDPSSS